MQSHCQKIRPKLTEKIFWAPSSKWKNATNKTKLTYKNSQMADQRNRKSRTDWVTERGNSYFCALDYIMNNVNFKLKEEKKRQNKCMEQTVKEKRRLPLLKTRSFPDLGHYNIPIDNSLWPDQIRLRVPKNVSEVGQSNNSGIRIEKFLIQRRAPMITRRFL